MDIFSLLKKETQSLLTSLFKEIHFSSSMKEEIIKSERDLELWNEKSFITSLSLKEYLNKNDGRGGERIIKVLREYMIKLRKGATDYSTFVPNKESNNKKIIEEKEGSLVLSRCPCPSDGEKTRCCNLNTIDLVTGCPFTCSYCAVESFYGGKNIKVLSNIEEKLNALPLSSTTWHIGTGQASDSIFSGDEYSVLSSLSSFAEKHPEIVIELKSKSNRNVFSLHYPSNMIFTWSVNAPTIIEKEERTTPDLSSRLECAENAVENGNLIGFHFHPLVYFSSWKEEYLSLINEIESRFSPEDVAMISLGTLTFTKSHLKRMRESNKITKVTEMPLVECAGKYSYPLYIKKEMFSYIYSSFSKEWRENVFFYLCMEDPLLWKACLGREYKNNKDFEDDMHASYFKKINSLKK